MLKDVIQNFSKQLDYEPEIENADSFQKRNKFIVCGMGGSNLATGIIKSWRPKLDVIICRDYGLPAQAGLPEMGKTRLKDYLVIASSYSGNTEETISAFREAQSRGFSLIVIATAGKLLEMAREKEIPYIQIPKINGNPRFAIGLNIRATLKAMGEESILNDISGLATSLIPDDYKIIGKGLAEKLQNKIPIIYSSGTNAGLARYWKVSFNETTKLPAFYNFLPELNHNEMAGFDSQIFDGKLNHEFAFVFLNDPDDEPQIQKRMAATKKVFEDRGFTVLSVDLAGHSLWHKSFANILIAVWTSYYLAEHYGVNPEDISMIEDFKKSLTQ